VKLTVRKTAALLPVACGLFLAAHSASAQEVYGKVGVLGIGAGYSHSINQHFGVRADFSTVGTYETDGTADKLDYDADFKANQLGLYGDYFPFGGSFRLTAGLHSRKLEAVANGRANSDGKINIGGIETALPLGPNDSAQAKVKWDSVAPYLGIGWGHHAKEGRGFGFIADIGVSFGSPSTSLTISDGLRNKLDLVAAATGQNVDAEIEKQRKEIDDDVAGISIFPHLFIGISYRF